MKKIFISLFALVAVSACTTTVYVPESSSGSYLVPVQGGPAKSVSNFQLAPSHWTDVAKIREEANRLANEVQRGKMTKVQAAQYLDRFRIQTVGRNSIDDNMFGVYLRSVVQSQSGQISAAQSRQSIQNALVGWQQRWPNMGAGRPNNPAFTNFLLEYMRMRPLN